MIDLLMHYMKKDAVRILLCIVCTVCTCTYTLDLLQGERREETESMKGSIIEFFKVQESNLVIVRTLHTVHTSYGTHPSFHQC